MFQLLSIRTDSYREVDVDWINLDIGRPKLHITKEGINAVRLVGSI